MSSDVRPSFPSFFRMNNGTILLRQNFVSLTTKQKSFLVLEVLSIFAAEVLCATLLCVSRVKRESCVLKDTMELYICSFVVLLSILIPINVYRRLRIQPNCSPIDISTMLLSFIFLLFSGSSIFLMGPSVSINNMECRLLSPFLYFDVKTISIFSLLAFFLIPVGDITWKRVVQTQHYINNRVFPRMEYRVVSKGLSSEALVKLHPTTVQSDDDVTACPICLGTYQKGEEIIYLPVCSHRFHSHCIMEWFQNKSTCPECRRNIEETFGINSSD